MATAKRSSFILFSALLPAFSILLSLLLLGPTLANGAQPAPANAPPEQNSDDRLAWWREARFGLFIHFGLYSQAAGEWNGKTTSGAGEWIMNDLQIPLSQYAALKSRFNPTNFDAREWVHLAKDAGMKYIVITAKHHEGFAMFRSSLSDWSIQSTHFKRDPLKELADACAEENMKLGFYYSIMDWHHPDYAPRKPWNDIVSTPPDFDRYVSFMKGQLHELLTGYGPIRVLWFDGQWENSWTYERGADLASYVRSLQPNIIINNRVSTELPLEAGQHPLGDYKTPEQSIPPSGFGPGVDWETCMTMNNTWGFKRSDQDWKSTRTLVRNLIDCAGKGGNYLLNIGPDGTGEIPVACRERLREIGAWMRVNGPAIYGSKASPFARPLSWGRCTTVSGPDSTTLYLHVFDWPADGELLLPGLRNRCRSAWLLADPQKRLRLENTESGVVITLPKTGIDPISTTIALPLVGAPDIQPVTIVQKRDGSISLPACQARLHGSILQYESGGLLDNIGYWTTPDDWADWEFEINRPGQFRLSAEIAALASGAFEIAVGGQTLRCSAPNTGSYVAFKPVTLGTIELASPGKVVLAVRPIKSGWQPMNLKLIRLDELSARR